MRTIIFLAVIYLLSPSIFAADFYRVDQGQTQTIEKHGLCKYVKNNSSHDIFVPAKTEPELHAFIDHTPSGVTVGDCRPCTLPWGGTIDHGVNVNAYSTNLPTGPCSEVRETRNCYDGSLSGSYSYGSCTNGCSSTPCGPLSSGGTCIAYQTNAPVGVSCSSVQQIRTCTNGSLSGTYTFSTCNSGCPAATVSNCLLQARAHGQSSGTCGVGYQGSCSYSCQNGTYVLEHNTCGSISCVNNDNQYNMCAGRKFSRGVFFGDVDCQNAIAECNSEAAIRCASGKATGSCEGSGNPYNAVCTCI